MLKSKDVDQLLELVEEWGTSIESRFDGLRADTLDGADCTKDLLEATAELEHAEWIRDELKGLKELIENQAEHVSLDADHQGELLSLCRELYAEWSKEFEDTQVINTSELMYQFYMLGKIEEGLQIGKITADDLDMLEAWGQELEATA